MLKNCQKFATLCTISGDIELNPERLTIGRKQYGIPTNLHFRGKGYYFEWEYHYDKRSTIRLQQMGISTIFKLDDCIPYAKEFHGIIDYLLPKEIERHTIAISFIREAIINSLALAPAGALLFEIKRKSCDLRLDLHF